MTIAMQYEEDRQFSISVTLGGPDGGSGGSEKYESTDIKDATLLRHFGIFSLDGAPVFDGFFPLRFP